MIYDSKNYTYNGLIVPMEFWKRITDSMVKDVKPVYWISSLGNIYNEETQKCFSTTIRIGDYVHVTLRTIYGEKVNASIHRLVCMAFNGMPDDESYQVDHKNCDKTCNFYMNLEWVTPQENSIRSVDSGLRELGEDFYNSIFTNEEVIEISNMFMNHISIDDICSIMERKIYPRQYSNLRKIILDILNKRTWKSVTKNFNFPSYSISFFSDDEAEIICKLLELDYNYDYILKYINRYNDSDNSENLKLKEVISAIKNGFRYCHISSKYNIRKGKKPILSEDEIDFVCKSIALGQRPKEIFESMGNRGEIQSVKQIIYRISAGLAYKEKVQYFKSLFEEGSTTIM